MFDDKTIITEITSIIYVKGAADYAHNRYSDHLTHYELIYKLSGECNVTFNNKTYNETADSIRFLPKGEANGYTVDTIKGGDCIDIFFDTTCAMPQKVIVTNMNQNITVRNLFIKIQKLWNFKKSGYYHKCMSLIYQILHELSKSERNYISNKQYKRIEPAIKYIEQNYASKNFNYKILPEKCDISYTYFKKLFVEKFGVTPIKYVNNLKIQYACDLLHSHLYTVTQIAEMTGFENVYYFSKVFKQIIGVSPKNYSK